MAMFASTRDFVCKLLHIGPSMTATFAPGGKEGCAQRSLVALIFPFERVSGLPAIAKTHPTTRWLAPLAVPTSD